MNIASLGRSLLVSSMVLVGLASLAGCEGVITRGGDGGGGTGGAGGAAGTTTSTDPGTGGEGGGGCDPAACPTPAIGMSHAQYLAMTGGDPSGALDVQFLLYGGGVQTPSCGAPNGDPSGCGGWTAHITLPTSDLVPGTYPLSDQEVDLYYTESADEGNGMCSGAASGGLEEGQIFIHSVSDSLVTFSVEGVMNVFDVPVNGYFQAERCPSLN